MVCLFGRQTVFVSCGKLPATNTAYVVGCRGRRELIDICGKFAVVSRGIWKNLPQKSVVPTNV